MTLIRALFVLALMLNGAAPPPAAAMDDAPDAATHAGHQGMDHQAPDDQPSGDCCDGTGCDCGCAGPQMVPLLVAATPRAWDKAPAVPTLEGVRFSASLIVAPFRPPA